MKPSQKVLKVQQLTGWQWYTKLSAVCFFTGAAMEFFMIKTGFYEKVTEIEAQRRVELHEQMQQLAKIDQNIVAENLASSNWSLPHKKDNNS